MSGDSYGGDVLSQVIGLAGDYVRQEAHIFVKTNLGPELPLYSGQDDGGGVSRLLGIKAGIVVRDADGRLIRTLGNPPPTEPIKLVIVVTLAAILGGILIRGVLPR